jgi:hypothetical protein
MTDGPGRAGRVGSGRVRRPAAGDLAADRVKRRPEKSPIFVSSPLIAPGTRIGSRPPLIQRLQTPLIPDPVDPSSVAPSRNQVYPGASNSAIIRATP